MRNKLLKYVKNNVVLLYLFNIFVLLKSCDIFNDDGSKKNYPIVVQLPITYKCNSKCVMCNIWNMNNKNEATVDEFAGFMKDEIFKNVKAVGVNGGEPSLVNNIENYIEEILKLPSLKSLNIITNGFYKTSILRKLNNIYIACKDKGIVFHVSISLDGIGEIHNKVRGKSTAFKMTISTINAIMDNQSMYCDSFDVGCTVLKQNIDHLIELDVYARSMGLNIKYRLGIDNKRIESDKLTENYTVLHSAPKQAAKEFFHYQISQSSNILDKYKYFSIFFWLNSKQQKRLLGCHWKSNGITLDSRGEVSYCAVASNTIGSLRNKTGENIFFNDSNIEYRKRIVQNNCNECIHDYGGKLNISSLLIFLVHMIINQYSMHYYRIKLMFIL